MPPFGAIGLPVRTQTARPDPIMTTQWMTEADIPDTVEGLIQELTAPRWLPVSVLDVAEILPSPEVDPDLVRNLWPSAPAWHAEAACASEHPEDTDTWFFGVDDIERPALPPAAVQAAREICYVCPVASQCLLWALTNDERFGIWGGTTGRQRTGMRSALRAKRVTIGQILAIHG